MSVTKTISTSLVKLFVAFLIAATLMWVLGFGLAMVLIIFLTPMIGFWAYAVGGAAGAALVLLCGGWITKTIMGFLLKWKFFSSSIQMETTA